MIGYGLRLSATGIAAGFVAALFLTRVMTSMLVGVKATDPITPARRAAVLDALAALRDE
jgi:hypothetical protein